MDRIKRGNKFRIEFQRIAPDKRERIVRLSLVIHANDFKARSAIANARATSATEEVE